MHVCHRALVCAGVRENTLISQSISRIQLLKNPNVFWLGTAYVLIKLSLNPTV